MKPPSRRRFPFRKEVRPLKDDEEIGQRWKCSNVWRLLVLIGRGLDLRERKRGQREYWKTGQGQTEIAGREALCGFEGARKGAREAEAPGRGRKRRSGARAKGKQTISGGNGKRVPPVPIPNTAVKPLSAEGTWLDTAREIRSLPESKCGNL